MSRNNDRLTNKAHIGPPGVGKSKLLLNQIVQDILAGNGLCLIDPHTTLYEDLRQWLAAHPACMQAGCGDLARALFLLGQEEDTHE